MALLNLSLSTLAILACVAFIAYCFLFAFQSSSLDKIPGPWHTRYTRLAYKFAIIDGRQIFFIHDLHCKYGKIVRLSPNEISVTDEQSFKQIYNISSNFAKSSWYTDFDPFPRANMFTKIDAQEHAKRRRILGKGFTKSTIRREWEPIVKSNMDLCLEKLLQRVERGQQVDILQYVRWLASDIVTTIMFGDSLKQLEKEENSDFMRSAELLMIGIGLGNEFPLLRSIVEKLPYIGEIFNTDKILMGRGEKGIATAKSRSDVKTFFSEVIAQEGTLGGMDSLDMQCEAAGLTFAGADTIANTLVYLIYAVLSNPQVQRTLEEEVSQLPQDFDDAMLEGLPFLNAVIDETHRLYGAIQSPLPRWIPAGGAVLGGGYSVPAGVVVSCQAYTFHRDPDMYKDPLVFKPSRWLNEVSKKDVILNPFGSGSRICAGIHIASMELRYFTATFFREARGKVKLSPSVTEKSMEFENYFINTPRAHKCLVQAASVWRVLG